MPKIKLSEETKQGIKAVSDAGFLFVKALEAMPKEVSDLYKPYFTKNKDPKAFIMHLTKSFAGVGLAIVKGFSPEERAAYIRQQRKKRREEKENAKVSS